MAQPCDFPVNIDTSVKAENCNITCNYKYDYNDSSCIVNSLGWRLNINYDLKSDGTKPQAFLNDKKFNVKEIRVLTPSKNTYNTARSDIEIVIYHEGGSDGKEQLMVTIPFVVSASTTLKQGGLILDNIIIFSCRGSSSSFNIVNSIFYFSLCRYTYTWSRCIFCIILKNINFII